MSTMIMDQYCDNELNHFPYAYDAGHFHRVYIGEVFNNRYRVQRKLGFGCSSTVWLVKDIASGHYFAMKVLSAMASGEKSNLFELEILQHLQAQPDSHPGSAHILQLLDHFDHPGSEGLHRCLIFPVMGESLVTYVHKFAFSCVPSFIAKRIAKQLLLAADFAHGSGVIHTDIKPENIMIKMTDASLIGDWYIPATEDSIAPVFSEIEPDCELSFLSWPNSRRVHPSQLPCIPLDNFYLGEDPDDEAIENVQLVLCDWGVATWTDPTRRRLDEVVPEILRAPELLLQAPWDAKVDIWCLGCLFLELVEDKLLFVGEGPIGDGWGYNAEWHILEMVELLGDIPHNLLREANPDIVGYAFDEDGKLIASRPNNCPPLQDWVKHLFGEDKDLFLGLLHDMFHLDPALRKPAKTLLESSWLEHSEHIDSTVNGTPFAVDGASSSDEMDPERGHLDTLRTKPDDQKDTHMVDVDPEPHHQPAMEWSIKHVTISSDGMGYIAQHPSENVPDGHSRKKVKLSSAGIAVPEEHDFDHTSSTEPPADTDAGIGASSTASEPFLGENEHSRKPLTTGFHILENTSGTELLWGAIWACKEAVVGFFNLLV